MQKNMLDYRGRKPVWCSFCGNYNLLTTVYLSLTSLQVEPEDLVVVSGIGCSSRLPGFVKSYGFHSIHGRALPIATGVKLANPKLTVLSMAGDGDMLGIGGGHLLHAIRRNADITCVLVDNSLYGMTKGQPSPTTPFGAATSTTPYGNPDEPIEPVGAAIALGAGYVGRGYTGNVESLQKTLTGAMRYKGFSFVHALTPCPTFNLRETYRYYIDRVEELPEGCGAEDKGKAIGLAADREKIYTGVFFTKKRPLYGELVRQAREKAGHGDIVEMIERSR